MNKKKLRACLIEIYCSLFSEKRTSKVSEMYDELEKLCKRIGIDMYKKNAFQYEKWKIEGLEFNSLLKLTGASLLEAGMLNKDAEIEALGAILLEIAEQYQNPYKKPDVNYFI